MTTIGEQEAAVAKFSRPDVTLGLVPFDTILAQTVHVLGLRKQAAAEMLGWSDGEWQDLFGLAFGADDTMLRLAILRAVAELRP